jgi:hypothetical protein
MFFKFKLEFKSFYLKKRGEAMLKNRLISICIIAAAILLTSGCATNRATASLTPGTELNKLNSFYVVKVPDDDRNINELIKANLAKRGYAVTTGPDQKPPYKADTVLTYTDKWMWDFTMYMLELTITLRDPNSSFPMAVGNSFHTSLTRKSPDEMIDEVLGNIFKAPKQ